MITGILRRPKMPHRMVAIAAVCLATLAACKKAELPQAPRPEFYGVKVDLAKLEAALTNADPEAQGSVRLVRRAFLYGQFQQAMEQLDKLSSNPNLTQAQKQLVSDVIEQTKQVIAKATPPPGH